MKKLLILIQTTFSFISCYGQDTNKILAVEKNIIEKINNITTFKIFNRKVWLKEPKIHVKEILGICDGFHYFKSVAADSIFFRLEADSVICLRTSYSVLTSQNKKKIETLIVVEVFKPINKAYTEKEASTLCECFCEPQAYRLGFLTGEGYCVILTVDFNNLDDSERRKRWKVFHQHIDKNLSGVHHNLNLNLWLGK